MPEFELYGGAGEKKFGKLSRVLETKRKLNSFIQQSNDGPERDLFYKLTRLLDDTDLHLLKGEDFLKNNPQNADSIFTTLSLNGKEIIALENARRKTIYESMDLSEIGKINNSIKLLRRRKR